MSDWRERFVTWREFREVLEHIERRFQMAASQQDIDTLTGQVQQVGADLATARTVLQDEIDRLATGNPQLDLTALQAAVEPLDKAVTGLGDLKPTVQNLASPEAGTTTVDQPEPVTPAAPVSIPENPAPAEREPESPA